MERALGVVLERGRRTEHRHHRVSRELLDRTARELDLRAHRLVERLELRANTFGIAFGSVRGRADEVGEENRDELALLARAHPGSVP